MATLERGFKSWCERVAAAMRVELEIASHAPLSARQLAEHLGIEIITLHDIHGLPAEVLRQLCEVDPYGWSAVSFTVDGTTTIVSNSQNSSGRQSSDIMHELSHVILEHEPSQLILSERGEFAMRSFHSKQEDEANWLGWTLLLPRVALMHCKANRKTASEISAEYDVSQKLVAYRRGVTGVDLQASRWTSKS
jgi:hypothetical protein